ncbi:MAG: hypothetical protein JNJ88_12615 [Planctomycetes bacterium]|nr:hypothetical protein [Planctomycetota bacterium]
MTLPLGLPAAVRNALLLAGFATALLPGEARPTDARGEGASRRHGVLWKLGIAAVAAASVCGSLAIPYLSDDFLYLARAENSPTVFDAMRAHFGGNEPFFRPTSYALFWFLQRLSPDDATLGHAVSAALFVADCLLIVPALRRCGAGRRVAHFCALLFAANPLGVDLVYWVTNHCSLLSLACFLSTIAWLPRRTLSRGRAALLAALSSGAYLSKEDTFLLPIVACAVAWLAAPRPSRSFRGALRLAAPSAVALLAALALRWWQLGSFGGYRGPSGESLILQNSVAGLLASLERELPSLWMCWVRTEESAPHLGVARTASALVPFVVLLFGARSAGLRGAVAMGGSVAICGIVPVAASLPVGVELEGTRHLVLPVLGLCWISAGCLGGARHGFALLVCVLTGFLGAGALNARSYRSSAEAVELRIRSVASKVAEHPMWDDLTIHDLPVIHGGVPAFGPSPTWRFRRATGRAELQLHQGMSGQRAVDAVLLARASGEPAFDLLDGVPEGDVTLESPWLLDLETADRKQPPWISSAIRVWRNEPGSPVVFSPLHDASAWIFPLVRAPTGAKLVAEAAGHHDLMGVQYPIPLAVNFPSGDQVQRTVLGADGRFDLPDRVDRFRLEIVPYFGVTHAQAVRVKLVP